MTRMVLYSISLATLWMGTASAETSEICHDVAVSITHPAQVVAEKVQHCTSGGALGWLKAVAAPQCCTPEWVAHPECYVIQNKTISEAWSETKTEPQCDVLDIAKNLEVALREFLDPKTFVFKSIAPLVDAMKDAIAISFVAAKPLPDDVKATLEGYMSDGVAIPYDNSIVERARWIPSDNPLAAVFSPKTLNSDEDSITWGDLIIAGPQLRGPTSCDTLGLWAHELTHVRQYRDEGFDKFLADYADELRQGKDYMHLSAEVEAYSVEDTVYRVCNSRLYQAANRTRGC